MNENPLVSKALAALKLDVPYYFYVIEGKTIKFMLYGGQVRTYTPPAGVQTQNIASPPNRKSSIVNRKS
jgi:hypothetical protein